MPIRQNKPLLLKRVSVILWVIGLLLWGLFALSARFLRVVYVDVFLYQSSSAPYVDKVVIQALLKQAVKSQHFLILNPQSLQQAVLALPWVKAVDVQFIWPDRLRAKITAQTALARYAPLSMVDVTSWPVSVLAKQVTGLLNEEGRLFQPAKKTYPEGVLLVGSLGKTQAMLRQYQVYQALLDPYQLKLQVVYYDGNHAWHLRLSPAGDTSDGVLLHLGHDTNEQGLLRFVKLYQRLLKSRFNTVASVDLRYRNGVAVAWQQPLSRTNTAY